MTDLGMQLQGGVSKSFLMKGVQGHTKLDLLLAILHIPVD